MLGHAFCKGSAHLDDLTNLNQKEQCQNIGEFVIIYNKMWDKMWTTCLFFFYFCVWTVQVTELGMKWCCTGLDQQRAAGDQSSWHGFGLPAPWCVAAAGASARLACSKFTFSLKVNYCLTDLLPKKLALRQGEATLHFKAVLSRAYLWKYYSSEAPAFSDFHTDPLKQTVTLLSLVI